MDFLNVPNTSSYSSEPLDPNGGISSVSINPNAYVGATLNKDDEHPKHPHKWLIISVISILGILSIGATAFFFYENSQQAAASTSEVQPVDQALADQTNGSLRPSIEPTPTYLLPSIVLSPTLAPNVTIQPTDMKPFIKISDEPSPTPTPRKFSWEIGFDKASYTSADINNPQKPSFTGTLKSPFVKDVLICLTDDQVFFTKKKDAKTITRLCDQYTPTSSTRTLKCFKYDPEKGIPVSASLFPATNCSMQNAVPDSGTYIMAATVYYSCNLPGSTMTNVPMSSCSEHRDVFSYDLVYTP